MPREITSHKVNACNTEQRIFALDEPGSGGANHRYGLGMVDESTLRGDGVVLSFQNGPIKEAGVNGVTHEMLLAVVIDRLSAFQRGPFACRENAIALTKLEEAVHW